LLENRSKEGRTIAEDIVGAGGVGVSNPNDTDKELHLSYGTKYSVLNLVDLAGSERLSESGSHAIEETQHINKSLFVLSNVIFKLSDTQN